MRAAMVVVVAQCRDQVAGVAKAGEHVLIQSFVPQATVEALDEAVLDGLDRRDVVPVEISVLLPGQPSILILELPQPLGLPDLHVTILRAPIVEFLHRRSRCAQRLIQWINRLTQQLWHHSVALSSVWCSFWTPMICSSVNLLHFMSVSIAGEQTNLKAGTS